MAWGVLCTLPSQEEGNILLLNGLFRYTPCQAKAIAALFVGDLSLFEALLLQTLGWLGRHCRAGLIPLPYPHLEGQASIPKGQTGLSSRTLPFLFFFNRPPYGCERGTFSFASACSDVCDDMGRNQLGVSVYVYESSRPTAKRDRRGPAGVYWDV